MYDYAHALTDALEGITHSLCTTEFEAHRPLYDWVVANVPVGCTPRQVEYIYIYIYIYVCVCVNMYIYINICMNICICIYVYAYLYIYIYR